MGLSSLCCNEERLDAIDVFDFETGSGLQQQLAELQTPMSAGFMQGSYSLTAAAVHLSTRPEQQLYDGFVGTLRG